MLGIRFACILHLNCRCALLIIIVVVVWLLLLMLLLAFKTNCITKLTSTNTMLNIVVDTRAHSNEVELYLNAHEMPFTGSGVPT